MESVLDVMQRLLPEGASLENVKESKTNFRIEFRYDGCISTGALLKGVFAGHEEDYATKEIALHMANISAQKKDIHLLCKHLAIANGIDLV